MKHFSTIQKDFLKYASSWPDKEKPSIFKKTIYRLPTKDELEEVHSFQLTPEELNQGFGYTIVGRGMLFDKQKEMIIESLQMLLDMYPENENFEWSRVAS